MYCSEDVSYYSMTLFIFLVPPANFFYKFYRLIMNAILVFQSLYIFSHFLVAFFKF